MHGYCSNYAFIHNYVQASVDGFLLKLCKTSLFFHFAQLSPSRYNCSKNQILCIQEKVDMLKCNVKVESRCLT